MEQFPTIYKKIQYALNDLPADLAHKEMFPTRKTIKELDLSKLLYKTSSVLALLFEEDGVLKLILTQRTEYKGKHSGQISFPGGKMETSDKSIEYTALRETEEEIGLNSKNINILGKLTDVYIPVSNFLVHPFIAYHKTKPIFEINYEVKEVFTFDVNLLLDPKTMTFTDINTSEGFKLKNMPCFIIQEKIVWGATAFILNEIRHMLLK